MLDAVEAEPCEVWPVIVAAGKGSRARASGLDAPKPVAPVAGVPSILRVLRNIQDACVGARTPVVIVSPETEASVRGALADEDVIFDAAGSQRHGDAVRHAHAVMKDFPGARANHLGHAAVVRPRTMARALKLAALFDEIRKVCRRPQGAP